MYSWILTPIHSQKCAAAVFRQAPSPQQANDYVKMIIAQCPTAYPWWHVIVDLQTLFALLDSESAGKAGDFATYNHILILANLMFMRCGNTSYFPMMAEFMSTFRAAPRPNGLSLLKKSSPRPLATVHGKNPANTSCSLPLFLSCSCVGD